MEGDNHPYAKLSRTPLALQTDVCGIPARMASVTLSIFALVFVSGSYLILGFMMLNARPILKEEEYKNLMGVHDMSDENVVNKDKAKMLTLSAGMLFIGGGIALFTSIFFVIGALSSQPQCFSGFMYSLVFCIIFSRIVPPLFWLGVNSRHPSESRAIPYLALYIVMACVDVVTVFFTQYCWGQLIGVRRNRKYLEWSKSPRYYITPGYGQGNPDTVLLPPGSYPRQV